jgi:hypothetical protein
MTHITHAHALTAAAFLAMLGGFFVLAPALSQPLARPQTIVTSALPDEAVCKHCAKPYAEIAHSPPAGFNPIAASDAQLAFYGFPPRPDKNKAPGNYALWKMVMSKPMIRIVPELTATNLRNERAKIVGPTTRTSGGIVGARTLNWSGYVITDKSNGFTAPNTYVYGSFFVPVAQQAFGACTGNWDYLSAWVGIDGYTSSDVFQAGIEADAKCTKNGTTASYYPWYEWAPTPQVQISNFPIRPGDEIYVYIWVTSKTKGNYFLFDITTQQTSSLAFTPPKNTKLTGDNVEWIVERTQINGQYPQLTNYTANAWYFAHAMTPDNVTYSPGNGNGKTVTSLTMVDNKNNPMSYGFTTPDSGLTYIDPKGATNFYPGTALWFFDTGKTYAQ